MESRLCESGLEAVVAGLRDLRAATDLALGSLAKGMDDLAGSAGRAGYVELAQAARQAAETAEGLRRNDAGERWTAIEAVGRVGQWILAILCREAMLPAATRQQRVLVVDDSRASSAALCQGFRSASFAVRNACSLDEVLTELVLFRPDIVVSDVFMPEVDVSIVGRAFRSLSRHSRCLLVLISGSEGEELRAKLREVKPDLFLPKKLGIAEVVTKSITEWNRFVLGQLTAQQPSSG